MEAKIPDEKMLVKIRYRKLILPSTYDVSEGDSLVLTRSVCTGVEHSHRRSIFPGRQR